MDTYAYFGPTVGEKKIGDASVSDHQSLIDWKLHHQVRPAQEVIKKHTEYIAKINATQGATTLRQVSP